MINQCNFNRIVLMFVVSYLLMWVCNMAITESFTLPLRIYLLANSSISWNSQESGAKISLLQVPLRCQSAIYPSASSVSTREAHAIKVKLAQPDLAQLYILMSAINAFYDLSLKTPEIQHPDLSEFFCFPVLVVVPTVFNTIVNNFGVTNCISNTRLSMAETISTARIGGHMYNWRILLLHWTMHACKKRPELYFLYVHYLTLLKESIFVVLLLIVIGKSISESEVPL